MREGARCVLAGRDSSLADLRRIGSDPLEALPPGEVPQPIAREQPDGRGEAREVARSEDHEACQSTVHASGGLGGVP